MNDLCIHEQYRPTCSICSGRDARERAAQAETPRTFRAKYSGQCRGCNLPIYVGETVAWIPGRPAVHASCVEDMTT